ncbi:MAG: hypothetical protein ACOH1T_07825 [Microbacteriaceae bacterium]
MSSLHDLALRGALWISDAVPAPSPSPGGAYRGDEDLISPGWVGFAATIIIAIAVVFLLIDMNRRVRRVRYREEVREKIAAEDAAALDSTRDSSTAPETDADA